MLPVSSLISFFFFSFCGIVSRLVGYVRAAVHSQPGVLIILTVGRFIRFGDADGLLFTCRARA